MYSIEADFDMNVVNRYIQAETKKFFDNLMDGFRTAGKKHVETIRAKTKVNGSFGNITWNLRSSIGYLIIYNGKIIEEYFPVVGGGTEGSSVGKSWAREVGLLVNEFDGIQLIIAAGMEYAVFVESNGIDVISFSTEAELPKMIMEEIR